MRKKVAFAQGPSSNSERKLIALAKKTWTDHFAGMSKDRFDKESEALWVQNKPGHVKTDELILRALIQSCRFDNLSEQDQKSLLEVYQDEYLMPVLEQFLP